MPSLNARRQMISRIGSTIIAARQSDEMASSKPRAMAVAVCKLDVRGKPLLAFSFPELVAGLQRRVEDLARHHLAAAHRLREVVELRLPLGSGSFRHGQTPLCHLGNGRGVLLRHI